MSERFPSFEAYLEAEHGGWAKGGKCSACMQTKAPRLTKGITRSGYLIGAAYCEACVRYEYGYDQAEAKVAHSLIYGLTRQALKDEIPFALLRRAMDEALVDDRDAEADLRVERV